MYLFSCAFEFGPSGLGGGTLVALDDGLDDSPACLPSAEGCDLHGCDLGARKGVPCLLPPPARNWQACVARSRSTDLVLIKPPNELESVRRN